MKNVLKILMALIIAVCGALSLVGCDPSQGDGDQTGLYIKKINGVYTAYKYVAEEDVTELDIAAVMAEQNISQLKIRKNTFSGNTSLKSVIVPQTVIEIEAGAFAQMKSLECITIPYVGRTANADAYLGQSKDATDKAVDSARTIAHLFGEDDYDAGIKTTINYDSASSTTVYMPRTLKRVIVNASNDYQIPMYAFNGAANLTMIQIEGNIKAIGVSAFAGCREIKVLAIPAGVQTIYQNAFNGCTKLETLNFAHGAALTVKSGAFIGTKLSRNALDEVMDMTDALRDDIFGQVK